VLENRKNQVNTHTCCNGPFIKTNAKSQSYAS
jgi:hypothetical protein